MKSGSPSAGPRCQGDEQRHHVTRGSKASCRGRRPSVSPERPLFTRISARAPKGCPHWPSPGHAGERVEVRRDRLPFIVHVICFFSPDNGHTLLFRSQGSGSWGDRAEHFKPCPPTTPAAFTFHYCVSFSETSRGRPGGRPHAVTSLRMPRRGDVRTLSGSVARPVPGRRGSEATDPTNKRARPPRWAQL